MTDGKILELRDITAGYNGTIVLENVNFTVTQTDFVGVIGANGCGKTTLLKVILGLVKPIKGTVRFYFQPTDNKDHPLPTQDSIVLERKETAKANQYVGYLPQVADFDRKFPMTVFDVVLSGLASKVGLFKQFSKSDKHKAIDVMERMKISHLKKKSIGELSGGQMQRVFLARALINQPHLLLLDEPNTFVDKGFERNFFDVLKELNKEIAIVMVSHDLGMISSYVKSIACVNRNLHHHHSNEINQHLLDNYGCPFDLIGHGKLPHRVLKAHEHNPDDICHCKMMQERHKHNGPNRE